MVVHENDEQVPKETTDVYIDAFNANVYVVKGFPHSIYNQTREELTEYQKNLANGYRNKI